MPRRKPFPYRAGYKLELAYPKRAATYPPTHGSGPRCRVVDFNPSDDGPWSMLQIMRVENDEVEEYTCAMPRYYAVPLILMNKRLSFFEASCHPNGTPILPPPPPPTTTTDNDDDGSRGGGLRGRDLREYSYLWQLRTRFLQAVFDMNHERRLDEGWRYVNIHGFVYRLYRRYGHEDNQRILYWRNEIKAGRAPYGTPDIADMEWESYILNEIASGVHINGFLWNRISQGYARVVKDEPPQEAWRAWRRATSRDLKPALYRTPACSPVRDRDLLPSVGSAHNGAGQPEQQQQQTQTESQSQSQSQKSQLQSQTPQSPPRGRRRPPLNAEDEEEAAVVTATRRAAGSTSGNAGAAAARRRAGINSDGDGDENDEDDEDDGDATMEYEVLTEALTPEERSHAQVWTLPFSVSGQLSEAAGLGSPAGRLRSTQVLLKFNAPEDENMKLSAIRCTFSPMEDVGEDFRPQLEVVRL